MDTEGISPPSDDSFFRAAVDYELWGFDRDARNIDPALRPQGGQYYMIELGVHNYLTSLGKEQCETGQVLMMLHGSPKTDGANAMRRLIVSVGGVSWSPKVFDVIYHTFVNRTDAGAPDLHTPFDIVLQSRPNRVSDSFDAADFRTSAELIDECMKHFDALDLSRLEYDILDGGEFGEGSLLRSRVTGITHIGLLWDHGLRTPLLSEHLAVERKRKREEQALNRLRQGDPWTQRPRARGRGRGGATGRSARSSAHARGRTGVVAADDALVGAIADRQGDGAAEERMGDEEHLHGPLADTACAGEMDMPEQELDGWSSEALSEMEAACGSTSGARSGDGVAEASASTVGLMPGAADQSTTETVEQLLSDFIGESLVTGVDIENADNGAATGSAAETFAGELVAPMPWEGLQGGSKLGYWYMNGRTVMRIQRDNPRGSTTVNCYVHSGCRLLLSNARCPEDSVLKRWLFETPPAPDGAPAAVRASFAQQHMQLAKSRWTARGTTTVV